jgi:hypothetical protein
MASSSLVFLRPCMSYASPTTGSTEVLLMANTRDIKLNVRLNRIDEQYLKTHVQSTAASLSDIVRALIRHTDPAQCKEFLRLEGKTL